MNPKDICWQLKLWRLPHLGNLELMHASNITHDYPLHVHEEYCLAIMIRGVETHLCGGKSYKAFAGDLIILNADEVHASQSIGTEYRVIRIPPQVLSRIASEARERPVEAPHFADPVIKDPWLYRLLLDLHLGLEQNASSIEHESALISAIGSLLARLNKTPSIFPPPGKEALRIKRIQNYLKSHYAENVSLTQLASIENLSAFHLLRLFRNKVGVPPHEYQTQLRVAHAKRLIQKGSSISQAAMETGFFDQSHFSRNFKRIVGITPGRYLSRSNIVQDTRSSVG